MAVDPQKYVGHSVQWNDENLNIIVTTCFNIGKNTKIMQFYSGADMTMYGSKWPMFKT